MYKYLIRLQLALTLLLLLNACVSKHPAEIVHLGEKFYGYEEFIAGDQNIRRGGLLNKPKLNFIHKHVDQDTYDSHQPSITQETEQAETNIAQDEIQVKELQPTKNELSNPDKESVKIVQVEEEVKKEVRPDLIEPENIEDSGNKIVKNANHNKYIWPIQGNVISTFGSKGKGIKNDGINIASPEGTKIKAISGGQVLYSGNELRGYGNLLIIKQSDGTLIAYAHQKNIIVKKGDNVIQGQIVGSVGMTGNVSTPQLHLAIRKNKKPVNPLDYLQ